MPVFINGKGPIPAVLDTGAAESGVYQWFAKKAALKPGPLQDVGGMTVSVRTPSYWIDKLTLDGRTIRHVKAGSYPNRHDSEKEAVVVGNDFMDGTIAAFDFPCRRVEIWPKPANVKSLLSSHARHEQGGAVVDGTQLTFRIAVGSAKGTAVLDTGNRQTKLNLQFARAAHNPLAPVQRLDNLLRAKGNQYAENDNSHFAGKLAPPVQRLRHMEMHADCPPATKASLTAVALYALGGKQTSARSHRFHYCLKPKFDLNAGFIKRWSDGHERREASRR